MSTRTLSNRAANGNASVNRVADPEKSAAIQKWAKGELAGDDGTISTTDVVVVPAFKKQGKNWVATGDFVNEHANGKTGWVLVMGAITSDAQQLNRWTFGNAHSQASGERSLGTAIVSGSLDFLNTLSAGALISGRLDRVYSTTPSNPNNLETDKHYISADAREMGLESKDKDGNIIYSFLALQENLNAPRPTQIQVANRQEINQAIALKKAAKQGK